MKFRKHIQILIVLISLFFLNHIKANEFAQKLLISDLPGQLPEQNKVKESLNNHPRILAALSHYQAEKAQSNLLKIGNHPWNIQLASQTRLINNNQINQQKSSYNEFSVSLQHTWRLPSKKEIDQQLAINKLEKAELTVGDTAHELTRQLLRLWIQVLRDNYLEKININNLATLEKMLLLIDKRLKLGDAAKIELIQAQTATLQAKSQLKLITARRINSQLELNKLFPLLDFSDIPKLSDPQPLNFAEKVLINNILEHNHELMLSKAEVEYKNLYLARLEEEKIPDPTLGLQSSRERNGEEKTIGFFISFPLAAEQRNTAIEAAKAELQVAINKYSEIQQKISGEAISLIQQTNAAYSTWQLTQSLDNNANELSAISLKSYQLGESSWYDWLNSQKQQYESKIMLANALIDTLELRSLLMIDAHQLWAELVDVEKNNK